MYKKTKKFIAFALVACLVITQMLFTNVAMAANRLEGTDRYQTAATIAENGWADGSDYAVLAYGEDFPDALCAAPLAKAYDAPILLTGTATLDASAKEALEKLGVSNVFIVGGTGVVSKNVESAVEDMGITVERLFGADRLETSVAIAQAVEEKLGEVDSVVVATAYDFPDALSISPIAAAKGMPILLTETNRLSAEVKDFIGDKQVYVVGGSGVVSNGAVSGLDYVRLGGADRFDTNVAIMEQFADDLDFSTIYLATADTFPDALAGSALAATTNSPIVLVGSSLDSGIKNFLNANASPDTEVVALGGTGAVGSSVVSAVEAACEGAYVELAIQSIVSLDHQLVQVKFNKELDGELNASDFAFNNGLVVTGVTFGADHSVVNIATTSQTSGVQYYLSYKGGSPLAVGLAGTTGAYNTNIQITPAETAAFQMSVPGTTDASYNRGRRTYTININNLVGKVDLALIPAENFEVDSDGNPTFTDDDDDYRADSFGNTSAKIEEINGMPITGNVDYVNDITVPADGIITVTVDMDNNLLDANRNPITYEKVRLVAYQDTDANNKLDLNEDSIPTEMVGISGVTAWHNGNASFGLNSAAYTVGMVLADINVFVDSNGKAYTYDSNDTFQYMGVGITEEQFEKILCEGDTINISYNTDASGISTFNLTTCTGYNAPDTITVTNINKNSGSKVDDVKINFTEPDNNENVVYTVKRASLVGPDGIAHTGDDLSPSASNLEWSTVITTSDGPAYYDYDIADGLYAYKVSVVNPVSGAVDSSAIATIEVPQANNGERPRVLQITAKDASMSDVVDTGDAWYILFNKEMRIDAGAVLEVKDSDNDYAHITLGVGNTFTTTTRGYQTLLTINFNGPLAVTNAGYQIHPDMVLNYSSLELIGATGVADVLGNSLGFVAANYDVRVDQTAPMALVVDDDYDYIHYVAPQAGDETFYMVFNEAVDPVSANDKANYIVTYSDGTVDPVTSAEISTSSKSILGDYEANAGAFSYSRAWTVVKVTVEHPLTGAYTVDLKPTSGHYTVYNTVLDLAGNAQNAKGYIVAAPKMLSAQVVDMNASPSVVDPAILVTLDQPVINIRGDVKGQFTFKDDYNGTAAATVSDADDKFLAAMDGYTIGPNQLLIKANNLSINSFGTLAYTDQGIIIALNDVIDGNGRQMLPGSIAVTESTVPTYTETFNNISEYDPDLSEITFTFSENMLNDPAITVNDVEALLNSTKVPVVKAEFTAENVLVVTIQSGVGDDWTNGDYNIDVNFLKPRYDKSGVHAAADPTSIKAQ